MDIEIHVSHLQKHKQALIFHDFINNLYQLVHHIIFQIKTGKNSTNSSRIKCVSGGISAVQECLELKMFVFV